MLRHLFAPFVVYSARSCKKWSHFQYNSEWGNQSPFFHRASSLDGLQVGQGTNLKSLSNSGRTDWSRDPWRLTQLSGGTWSQLKDRAGERQRSWGQGDALWENAGRPKLQLSKGWLIRDSPRGKGQVTSTCPAFRNNRPDTIKPAWTWLAFKPCAHCK